MKSKMWAVTLAEPIADAGGPYSASIAGFLELDASGSLPSNDEAITLYEWDLNINGDFSDASGMNPAAIRFADLQDVWDMEIGPNTIQLRVTDSAATLRPRSTPAKS